MQVPSQGVLQVPASLRSVQAPTHSPWQIPVQAPLQGTGGAVSAASGVGGLPAQADIRASPSSSPRVIEVPAHRTFAHLTIVRSGWQLEHDRQIADGGAKPTAG
jgi:hypothetical protein